jgi:hypothetical protein
MLKNNPVITPTEDFCAKIRPGLLFKIRDPETRFVVVNTPLGPEVRIVRKPYISSLKEEITVIMILFQVDSDFNWDRKSWNVLIGNESFVLFDKWIEHYLEEVK